jgi:hypothetical protein
MSRNMSFSMTTEAVRNRSKTVTRRLGWWGLQPGTILQAVEKAQGLRKGEHVKPICLNNACRPCRAAYTQDRLKAQWDREDEPVADVPAEGLWTA